MFISPVFITFAITFLVAYYIMEILSLIIDTIFMCYLYEEQFLAKDREDGADCFAPKKLKVLLVGHGKAKTKEDKDIEHDAILENAANQGAEHAPGCCKNCKKNRESSTTVHENTKEKVIQ